MNGKRLIDADALYSEIARIYSEHYEKSVYKFIHDFSIATLKRIRKAPAIDAVEVVRCKNCRFIINRNDGTHGCYRHFIDECKLDDYCSYGEKAQL